MKMFKFIKIKIYLKQYKILFYGNLLTYYCDNLYISFNMFTIKTKIIRQYKAIMRSKIKAYENDTRFKRFGLIKRQISVS